MIFLVFTHMMRRPCWYTKQWQEIAHVFNNNSIKFPKYFLHICSVHQQCLRDINYVKTEISRVGVTLDPSAWDFQIPGKPALWDLKNKFRRKQKASELPVYQLLFSPILTCSLAKLGTLWQACSAWISFSRIQSLNSSFWKEMEIIIVITEYPVYPNGISIC